MRRLTLAVAGAAVLLISPAAQARRPHHQEDGAASPRLSSAHTRHVEESINRILDSGVLSPSQETALRAGLDAFAVSRAASERESSPGLNSFELDMQATPELLQAMGSDLHADGALTSLPSGLLSLGGVVCLSGDELFLNGRFLVVVSFQDYSRAVYRARACRMTNSSGYFFWADQSNVEIPMKMLNACAWASPPAHWVFAAGLTDFGIELTVIDAFTGIRKTYTNTLGQLFNTQLDKATPFPCP